MVDILVFYLSLNLIVKELLLKLGEGVVATVIIQVQRIEHIPEEEIVSQYQPHPQPTGTHFFHKLNLQLRASSSQIKRLFVTAGEVEDKP